MKFIKWTKVMNIVGTRKAKIENSGGWKFTKKTEPGIVSWVKQIANRSPNNGNLKSFLLIDCSLLVKLD